MALHCSSHCARFATCAERPRTAQAPQPGTLHVSSQPGCKRSRRARLGARLRARAGRRSPREHLGDDGLLLLDVQGALELRRKLLGGAARRHGFEIKLRVGQRIGAKFGAK